MTSRSVVLTGAPRPSTLDWKHDSLLQHPASFITPKVSSAGESESPAARWRSVGPLVNPTGAATVEQLPAGEGTSFFAGGNIDRYSGQIVDADEATLSEFYDHSFALHEGIGSFGQSDCESFNDTSNDSLWDESVNDSTVIQESSSRDDAGKGPNPPGAVEHLSDLEDMPDAGYIQSVTPRVVTTNFVVAVINIRPRQRVRTRWGRERDLVEVLVSDETRSAFRVTFWLPASDDGVPKTLLEQALGGLRPRDVVLLRSVALSSFRGQVYGQSLRDNLTKIDLLSRRPIDSADTEGAFKWKSVVHHTDNPGPLLLKVRKVRQWILNFIGLGNDADSASSVRRGEEGQRRLPPDTQ